MPHQYGSDVDGNIMRAASGDLLAAGPRGRAHRRSIGWLAGGMAGAALLVGGYLAPADHLQGQAQRLMYVHVPAAWTGFLAFALVAVASAAYLLGRDPRWDRWARAAAEVGVGLTALAIGSGAIWGQLVWGTWWAWDPRLVSTALLLLVYAGYLAGRRLLDDPVEGAPASPGAARPAALVGVLGFALVPVVHFSVVWWRSLHQPATVLAPDRPPMDMVMGLALVLSVAAAMVLAFWALVCRVAVLEQRAARAQAAPDAQRERVTIR
jgi:heme exporter protein C